MSSSKTAVTAMRMARISTIRRRMVWFVAPAPAINARFTQGASLPMAWGATATKTAMPKKARRMSAVSHVARVPNNSAIAVIGASSPMAPWIITESPTRVPMSLSCLSIGVIVPSAVEVTAMPMTMASGIVSTRKYAPAIHAIIHISHVVNAVFACLDFSVPRSISKPARRNSAPTPISLSMPMPGSSCARSRIDGPMIMPKMMSSATDGSRLRSMAATIGASKATAMIHVKETRDGV